MEFCLHSKQFTPVAYEQCSCSIWACRWQQHQWRCSTLQLSAGPVFYWTAASPRSDARCTHHNLEQFSNSMSFVFQKCTEAILSAAAINLLMLQRLTVAASVRHSPVCISQCPLSQPHSVKTWRCISSCTIIIKCLSSWKMVRALIHVYITWPQMVFCLEACTSVLWLLMFGNDDFCSCQC